ncbi:MAG TPA: hypothetical protein DCE42_14380, partial [Myxococcales bacterium]|nr:hypothetical protein [Myxococcales bacterium]
MALGETIGQLFGKSGGKQTLLTLGESALLRGRGDEAEARFQAILETYPEHRRARMGLMEAWLCQGKSDLVLDTYDKLPEQEKTIFDDQFLLALSLQVGSLKRDGYLRWLQTPRQGSDRHAAIAHLAKTFAKCGIFSIHWAESAIRRLEFQEAEQALRQMRDAQPPLSEERVSTLYAKRDAVLLKDHPEVVHLLEECQALDEPHERLRRLEPVAIKHMSIAALQHDTGVAFFDCGQPEAGIRFLSRAVGCNPYWVNAWLNLGRVSLAAERYVRARDAFQRILMLFEFPWVRDVYGNIDDFISNHPERPHVEAGLDRAQNGDYYGAAESFRVALTHNPDAPFLIFLLA